MRKKLRIIILTLLFTLLSMTYAWSIDFETGIGSHAAPIVSIGPVTFGAGWVYNVDGDFPGGGGAQANEPSDETVALLNGNLVGVPADTRITFPSDVSNVSFWYSLNTNSGNRIVSFYNQSGVLLGTLTLDQCGTTLCTVNPPVCAGDPGGTFCSWTQVNFSANNIRYMEFSVVVGAPADWSMDDLLFVNQAATVPTLNEWGIIVFMVLAGLGSIYYLRRKKTAV